MNEGKRNLLKGSQSEAFAVSQLIQIGVSVSIPTFKQCKYDCIVDNSEELFKVQIKKISQHPEKEDRINVKLTSGHYSSDGQMITKKYLSEEVDVFLLVDIEKQNCFWVPFEEAPTTSMTLSYVKGRKGQKINYYEDFLLENNLNLKQKEKETECSFENTNEADRKRSVFDY